MFGSALGITAVELFWGSEGRRAAEMQLAEKQAELERAQVESATLANKRKAAPRGGGVPSHLFRNVFRQPVGVSS